MQDSPPVSDLIARFVQAAEAAQTEEDAFRREAAQRIAGLEVGRATAFRRLNLVRTVAQSLAEAPEPGQAVAQARRTVAHALGWDEPGPRQTLVLDRLTPVLEALAALARPAGEAADETGLPDPEAALHAFETWYRAETGSTFYALFDRYMPETPRVDF